MALQIFNILLYSSICATAFAQLPAINELGRPCVEDIQCQSGSPGPWSICSASTSTCECLPIATHEYERHVCILKADIVGQGCSSDTECTAGLGPNCACYGNKCLCSRNGGVASSDNRSCLPIINNLDGSCEQNQQCQSGTPGYWSECRSGTCLCKDGSINEPEFHVCYKKAELVGDACTTNIQCTAGLGAHSQCYGNRCQCYRNSGVPSQSNRRCLPIVNELQRECEEDQQCQSGAPGGLGVCHEGTCQCQQNATNEGEFHTCYKIAELVGDACTNNIQCTAGLGAHSQCYGNKCQCYRNSGVPSQSNRRCLPIVNELQRECEESQQCQYGAPGGLSECRNGTCQCQEGSINEMEFHTCYKMAEFVGDPCSVNIQCTAGLGPNSQCYGNKCQCYRNSGVPSQSNRKCLPIVNELQRDCEEDQQCQSGTPGSLSECSASEKVCKCPPEGVAEIGTNNCLKKADFVGDPCTKSLQCQAGLGHPSSCSYNLCICNENEAIASANNTMCLPIVNFLERECVEDIQCQAGVPGANSQCSAGGVCECKSGSTHECHQHVCLKLAEFVGEGCQKDVQCTEGAPGEMSSCSGGTCQCQAGAHLPPTDCESRRCVAI